MNKMSSCIRNSIIINSKLLLKKQSKIIGKNEFSVSARDQERKYEEVRIPVPWGHLAGKWWGPQDQRPILCLHGWQESCGSFDPLVKLLPENVALLGFDFPGHGLSSRLPSGVYYHGVDAPVLIRRIQKYFNWSKVSLLGHSMGGITSFMYTCLYPDQVDLLIQIDALKPFSKEPGGAIQSTVENIESFLRYDELNEAKTRPPSYTYDELCQKMIASTRKSLSYNSCKYVLQRIITPDPDNPDRWIFSRDHRLKTGVLVGIQHVDLIEYAKRIKCPHLVMKAANSTYFEKKQYVYDIVDVLKANNSQFEWLMVDGTHHVHMNEPERIALIINRFLQNYNHFDRTEGGIKEQIKIQPK